ncbi:uncharacterized protein ACOB8E_013429 [Sarcophilus harrisii]
MAEAPFLCPSPLLRRSRTEQQKQQQQRDGARVLAASLYFIPPPLPAQSWPCQEQPGAGRAEAGGGLWDVLAKFLCLSRGPQHVCREIPSFALLVSSSVSAAEVLNIMFPYPNPQPQRVENDRNETVSRLQSNMEKTISQQSLPSEGKQAASVSTPWLVWC